MTKTDTNIIVKTPRNRIRKRRRRGLRRRVAALEILTAEQAERIAAVEDDLAARTRRHRQRPVGGGNPWLRPARPDEPDIFGPGP